MSSRDNISVEWNVSLRQIKEGYSKPIFADVDDNNMELDRDEALFLAEELKKKVKEYDELLESEK